MIILDKVSLRRSQQKSYKDILSEVSLTVNQGEIYTVLGPSGSGKSTLLRLINRLVEPSSGDIYIEGRNVQQIPVVELRRRIGMVFQQPALFLGTVEENILYGPQIRKDSTVKANDYLTMVGLEENLLPRDPVTLSGGQQQRVALARALANKPEVVLLDEPTSALDIRSTEQLQTLIMHLVRDLNLTVVWVTHNIEQAKKVGDRAMLLVNGKVIEDQVTQDFFYCPHQDLTRKFLEGTLETEGTEQ